MSEKTEQPSSKKLRQAREDGQVAHSKDFTQTVIILALFGYLLSNSEALVKSLAELMLLPLDVINMPFEDAANVLITKLATQAVWIMLPFMLIIIGLGMFVEMLQTGMLFSVKALMPSAKKLNFINNLKNIFAIKNVIEVLKSILKISILASLIYSILSDSLPTIVTIPQAELPGIGITVGILLKSLIVKIALAYAIIAAADFAYQRYQYTKGLMMSKDEVKQEYKEMEGNPEVKQQRKHLHQEMMQQNAVSRTRKASVVVTNPTHLAIAILYEKETTPLPVVVAKGEGLLAERMIKAAREEGIPILQNIPLAHSLMDTAEIDQYIPSELIEPVAEVLRLIRNMPNMTNNQNE
ncbi:MAG: EscU/YscU/HrcU family type secretion system export apparatus switch protein [Proteobacteria bacterium]|nr:EscU/YscU/HrcU family type secretion system export apparatus switch protein [Pseudomonadota bacterium]